LIDLSFPPDYTNLGSPIQDGFFVINWLRHTPALDKIPLIIISGTEPASYQERIADLGVKACCTKPLNNEGSARRHPASPRRKNDGRLKARSSNG